MGIMPEQFWGLTPFEFSCVLRGYERRQQLQRRLLAWTQANLIRCWVKNGPSVNELLGGQNLTGMTKQQIKDHYAMKRGSG